MMVEDWLNANNTNGSALFKKATLPNALYTQLKRGSEPRPTTIRKLADAMGIPRGRLFMAAGYCDEEDLWIVDKDPVIEKLFLYWKNVPDSKKDLMLHIMRTASEHEIEE
ncbi:hypothetical protein CL653_02005 [bacterium]|nr:hypothetical protein [bacterium]